MNPTMISNTFIDTIIFDKQKYRNNINILKTLLSPYLYLFIKYYILSVIFEMA